VTEDHAREKKKEREKKMQREKERERERERERKRGHGESRGRDAPEFPTASPMTGDVSRTATYLNIKMNSTKREKNTATLSMVRSITKSCRRKFGRNRTSFRILSSRKVRSTLRPELPPRSSTNAWQSSTTLKPGSLIIDPIEHEFSRQAFREG